MKESIMEECRLQLDEANSYGDVWALVKYSVKQILKQQRSGMMLFLDDLPLQVGAYHPVGTNNIVLNRRLIEIVEGTVRSKRLKNAFIYILLLHEYLHALGYVSERKARRLVYHVSKNAFGENNVVSHLAQTNLWSLLKKVPLDLIRAPKKVMEIVRDFEKSNRKYIV